MDKTGEAKVGITPCEICGALSQTEKDGYFYCWDCMMNQNKKKLVFSRPSIDKTASEINNQE